MLKLSDMYLHHLILLTAVLLWSNLSLSRQEQTLIGNTSFSLSQNSPNLSLSQADNDEEKRIKLYQASDLFVPNYDPDMKSLPDVQLAFLRNMIARDMEFYREVLREAIDKRNNFAPSVGLMFKHTGRLLGNFIRSRQTEQLLSSRKEIKPSYFEMLAKLSESIIDKSNSIKKEKAYSKKNVDVADLYRRCNNSFNYSQRIVDVSPVAIYVRWDLVTLYKNELSNPEHDRSFIDEAADLLAVSSQLAVPIRFFFFFLNGHLFIPTNQVIHRLTNNDPCLSFLH